MSIILAGDASNVTSPLTATIASIASVGGHFRCTTSSAHLFGNGDTVNLALTVSSVPKNATVTIAVIDATHFDILSSLSFDPTGGTGTATDLSLTPQIQVPTDGDTFSLQLSGMLSAIQALCDRTQALKKFAATGFRLVTLTYTATTTGILFPAWTIAAWVEAYGGGGGGGGGGGAINAANASAGSAGGGGGSRIHRTTFVPTQGHSYTANVGAGGTGTTGALATVSGFPGGDGGDSSFVDATSSTTILLAKGAMGGFGGFVGTTTFGKHAAGGRSERITLASYSWGTTFATNTLCIAVGDAYGADGIDSKENTTNGIINAGWPNPDANPSTAGAIHGGNAGTPGTISGGNVYGGGGGGGGGAGPGGSGGDGGNGGNGVSGGTGVTGSNGTAAAANSGGGGGGGGGGGAGTTPGAGGNGGNGGSGLIVVRYLVPGGVP